MEITIKCTPDEIAALLAVQGKEEAQSTPHCDCIHYGITEDGRLVRMCDERKNVFERSD